MSLPLEQTRPGSYTISQYLEYEGQSQEKHEYRDGQIIAMAGGTYHHGVIVINVGGEIRQRLKGKPCRAADSTVRVRIPRTPLYTYPDITVVCGQAQFDPQDSSGQTLINPRVIVEVLSPSTEAYDRGEKFSRYRQLDSLEEYVLVSQDTPSVETFFRQGDGGWLLMPYSGLEAIARIRCLEIDLPLREVYAGVTFPAPPVEAKA